MTAPAVLWTVEPKPERDEPVKIDLDPHVAFRAWLRVDPDGDPSLCADCGHPLPGHHRPFGEQTHRGSRGGVPYVCRVERCGCRIKRSASASS